MCWKDARRLYTERIMDWTDYYMENLYDANQTDDALFAVKSVCQLWIDYAEMEIDQKQYKKAASVFDKAMEDSIAKTTSSVYLRYSSFCEHINKLGHAKTVLVRGLTSHLSQQDADQLWTELLSVVKKSGSSNLTMKLLFDAIILEKSAETVTLPSESLLNPLPVNPLDTFPQPDGPLDPAVVSPSPVPSLDSQATEHFPPMNESSRDYDDVSFLTPEQLTSTFHARPHMLFNFSEQVF